MIPDESTPIKNFILTDIFAKGKLSYAEMRIATFIIRWSWGFDAGDHRQEWTKDFTISDIAKEINMNRSACSEVINKMLRENKLKREGNKYQFNEHYNSWAVGNNDTVRIIDTVGNPDAFVGKNDTPVVKTDATVGNPDTLNVPKRLIIKDINAQNSLRKETIKETNNKETIKKIDYALKDKNQNILLKDEKQEKAKELIKEFSRLRNIPLDSGFFSKNFRSARALVSTYPVEYVLAGIEWRLANDPDGFWESRLWSLNSVYSHFAEWIAQAKLSTGKTFEDWLDQHPEQDYDKVNEPDAKLKAFFVAFNRALKDGIVPTEEEWERYQKARELQKESLRR